MKFMHCDINLTVNLILYMHGFNFKKTYFMKLLFHFHWDRRKYIYHTYVLNNCFRFYPNRYKGITNMSALKNTRSVVKFIVLYS